MHICIIPQNNPARNGLIIILVNPSQQIIETHTATTAAVYFYLLHNGYDSIYFL